MKYLVGGYVLDNMQFSMAQQPVRLSNSLLQMTVITHQVIGKLRAATQAQLDTKIRGLENALRSGSYAAAGLYFDNNQPTAHILTTSNTLDGIKLTSGPNYPNGSGAEYSVYRTVQFSLQAEVLAQNRNLLQFRETITVNGGTRPSVWLIPAEERFKPIRQRLPRIPYSVTQTGTAETYSAAFAYPVPLGDEPDEQSTTQSGPEFSAGRQATRQWSWTYRWTTIQNPSGVFPTDRRGF
jgi:hypothetical protein